MRHELVVAAFLRDAAVRHYENLVHHRQPVNAVSYQNTRLKPQLLVIAGSVDYICFQFSPYRAASE